MNLALVVCGNNETLGCDSEQTSDWISRVIDCAWEWEDVDVIPESDFAYWHGGPGKGRMHLRLPGYGPVTDFDDARAALGFLLSGGGRRTDTMVTPPDEWPTAEEIEKAFEILDEARDIEPETEEEGGRETNDNEGHRGGGGQNQQSDGQPSIPVETD